MTIEHKADLHTHSLSSDGTLPAHEVVRLASEAGLEAVALTDHDTVAGLDEAITAGHTRQIEVVPGVEISTVAGEQDIHVLGYWMDYRDPVFLSRLEQQRTVRERRNELMIAKLNELGVTITLEEVIEGLPRPLAPQETIGRPHMADVMVVKGYVGTVAEAFARYLGKEGAAYVNPPRIMPDEAIRWIHEAGGAAVLAHPGLYGDDALVERLIAVGLDGIEVRHSDHSQEDEARYERLAQRHGLIMTAGSDFHGERHGQVLHGPLGARTVRIEVVQQLRQRANERRRS